MTISLVSIKYFYSFFYKLNLAKQQPSNSIVSHCTLRCCCASTTSINCRRLRYSLVCAFYLCVYLLLYICTKKELFYSQIFANNSKLEWKKESDKRKSNYAMRPAIDSSIEAVILCNCLRPHYLILSQMCICGLIQ